MVFSLRQALVRYFWCKSSVTSEQSVCPQTFCCDAFSLHLPRTFPLSPGLLFFSIPPVLSCTARSRNMQQFQSSNNSHAACTKRRGKMSPRIRNRNSSNVPMIVGSKPVILRCAMSLRVRPYTHACVTALSLGV